MGHKGRARRPALPSPATRGWAPALLALGLVACFGTLGATLRGPARGPGVSETFECALQELQAMGYRPTAFDRDAGRLAAQKVEAGAKRPHTTFRRVLSRQEVKAGADELTVMARTVVEFESRRGPTEEEESASAAAQADARSLIERCGRSAAP
jgi:hypothetical protein